MINDFKLFKSGFKRCWTVEERCGTARDGEGRRGTARDGEGR
jgi:hypothetical protein